MRDFRGVYKCTLIFLNNYNIQINTISQHKTTAKLKSYHMIPHAPKEQDPGEVR